MTDPRAFARITPEAYASATQLGVDQALSLAQVARGGAFATDRAEAGAFTFAQTLGQWHRLAGDAASGSSAASAQSYGFLGGVGYGDRGWMIGAFAGYLNGRQQIDALGARTRADGTVAGLHARYTAPAGWGFSGSLLYDGGEARTDRALPGTVAASARYGLHSWISDVSLHHTLAEGGDWTLRSAPRRHGRPHHARRCERGRGEPLRAPGRARAPRRRLRRRRAHAGARRHLGCPLPAARRARAAPPGRGAPR
ncbi:hypothetical protein FHY05_002407 [Sphingomonas sp. BK580]|nr:hypothetical protein [Sphingomonas sp. BK580]